MIFLLDMQSLSFIAIANAGINPPSGSTKKRHLLEASLSPKVWIYLRDSLEFMNLTEKAPNPITKKSKKVIWMHYQLHFRHLDLLFLILALNSL